MRTCSRLRSCGDNGTPLARVTTTPSPSRPCRLGSSTDSAVAGGSSRKAPPSSIAKRRRKSSTKGCSHEALARSELCRARSMIMVYSPVDVCCMCFKMGMCECASGRVARDCTVFVCLCSAPCSHLVARTSDVGCCLAHVHGQEGAPAPEIEQLLGQPVRHAQVVQRLWRAICQGNQQGGKLVSGGELLLQETACVLSGVLGGVLGGCVCGVLGGCVCGVWWHCQKGATCALVD